METCREHRRQPSEIDSGESLAEIPGMATATKAKGTAKARSSPRLAAKQAVVLATDYFRDLFPEAAKANLMLEEIEESPDGKQWWVTLGFDQREPQKFLNVRPSRFYKRLTIDQATGRVLSVKIRSVD